MAAARLLLAFELALSFTLTSSVAAAEPQWNVSVLAGAAGEGRDREVWQNTAFYGGLRGDILLGRERNADAGAGPYAEIATAAFDALRMGGGAELLIPVSAYFPLIPSVGGYARYDETGFEPGVSARLFFGSRSYNFHSSYGMAGGLLVGIDYGLGESRELVVIIAAQLDGLVLSLPFVAGYTWLRGPPDE
jgi:hypothetical protein